MNVLLAMHSPRSKAGAVAVMDADTGSMGRIRIISPSDNRNGMLRCIAASEERLYAATESSIKIFTPGSPSTPLRLEKEVVMPEWTYPMKHPAPILAAHYSAGSNVLLAGNNAVNAVDVFSPDGTHLDRVPLWKIAAGKSLSPAHVPPEATNGQIRTITESGNGSIIITVMSAQPGKGGFVTEFSSGRILADRLHEPSGAVAEAGRLYAAESMRGRLLCLAQADMKNIWTARPAISDPRFKKSLQHLKGVWADTEKVMCGVYHAGRTKFLQAAPRIVAFDIETGEQKAEHALPDRNIFALPIAMNIITAPEWAADVLSSSEECLFFNSGGRIKSEPRAARTMPAGASPLIPSRNPLHSDTPSRVVFDNVSLCFRRNARFGFGADRHLRKNRLFWALKEISFTLHENETVGVIGRNGSGKSTLSMVCTGILKPDKGTARINGRAQLLALGAGFRNELTGRENVYISGTLLGLSRSELGDRMQEIEEFTELGDFMDEPVRIYSSGMRSRLGFAISTVVEPEVLVLDETISTGDNAFQQKATARMRAMCDKAKTVIIVSHNPAQLKKICSRVLWLEKGRLVMDGEPNETLREYAAFCNNPDSWLEQHPEIQSRLET